MKQNTITRTQFLEMMLSAKGSTFTGLTYHVDESKSRTIQGKKALQKTVETTATLNSVYQSKINRLLEKNGIVVEWTPNPINGRETIEGVNRCIVVASKTGELQLAYVNEKHAKTTTQLFLNGQPVDRKDVWNEQYITPSGLRQNDKASVKNSMFNHIMKASATAESEGNTELAESLKTSANKVANCADFQGLEFLYRTLGIKNIVAVRFGGESYTLTGETPTAEYFQS